MAAAIAIGTAVAAEPQTSTVIRPTTTASAETIPSWLPGLFYAALGSCVSIALAWMNNRHQRRLENDRAAAARVLEADKAALTARTKVAEKKAMVATDALLASLELLEGIEAAASVARIIGDPDDDTNEDARERTRRRVAARWEWLRKYDDQFDRAYKLSQVYLPESVHDALERVRKLKWPTHVDRLTHAELVGMDQRRDTEKFFDGGYTTVPAKINALRDELKQLLRPLVELAPQ